MPGLLASSGRAYFGDESDSGAVCGGKNPVLISPFL